MGGTAQIPAELQSVCRSFSLAASLLSAFSKPALVLVGWLPSGKASLNLACRSSWTLAGREDAAHDVTGAGGESTRPGAKKTRSRLTMQNAGFLDSLLNVET